MNVIVEIRDEDTDDTYLTVKLVIDANRNPEYRQPNELDYLVEDIEDHLHGNYDDVETY